MSEYTASNDYRNYLMHYGTLGMKWGVRRYQNADGSLTAAGRARLLHDYEKKLENKINKYSSKRNKYASKVKATQQKQAKKLSKAAAKSVKADNMLAKMQKKADKYNKEYDPIKYYDAVHEQNDQKLTALSSKANKANKVYQTAIKKSKTEINRYLSKQIKYDRKIEKYTKRLMEYKSEDISALIQAAKDQNLDYLLEKKIST